MSQTHIVTRSTEQPNLSYVGTVSRAGVSTSHAGPAHQAFRTARPGLGNGEREDNLSLQSISSKSSLQIGANVAQPFATLTTSPPGMGMTRCLASPKQLLPRQLQPCSQVLSGVAAVQRQTATYGSSRIGSGSMQVSYATPQLHVPLQQHPPARHSGMIASNLTSQEKVLFPSTGQSPSSSGLQPKLALSTVSTVARDSLTDVDANAAPCEELMIPQPNSETAMDYGKTLRAALPSEEESEKQGSVQHAVMPTVDELLSPLRESSPLEESSLQDFLDMIAARPSGQLPEVEELGGPPSLSWMEPQSPSHMGPNTCNSAQCATGSPVALIAIDVDEVLCDYVGGFRRFLEAEYSNSSLPIEQVFQEGLDLHSERQLQFMRTGGLNELLPVVGALKGVQKLRAAGVRLAAVTARPLFMKESTTSFLMRLFPPETFDEIHFVKPGEKGYVARLMGALVLVDDEISNACDAVDNGVVATLFDLNGGYPWAKAGRDGVPLGITVVDSWSAACDFILVMLKVQGCMITDTPRVIGTEKHEERSECWMA